MRATRWLHTGFRDRVLAVISRLPTKVGNERPKTMYNDGLVSSEVAPGVRALRFWDADAAAAAQACVAASGIEQLRELSVEDLGLYSVGVARLTAAGKVHCGKQEAVDFWAAVATVAFEPGSGAAANSARMTSETWTRFVLAAAVLGEGFGGANPLADAVFRALSAEQTADTSFVDATLGDAAQLSLLLEFMAATGQPAESQLVDTTAWLVLDRVSVQYDTARAGHNYYNVSDRPRYITPRDVADAIWSLTRLRYANLEVYQGLTDALCALRTATDRWGAHYKAPRKNSGFARQDVVLQRTAMKTNAALLTPAENARVLWCHASLGFKHPLFVKAAVEELIDKVDHFTPSELVSLAWSFARLEGYSPEFLHLHALRCVKLIDESTSTQAGYGPTPHQPTAAAEGNPQSPPPTAPGEESRVSDRQGTSDGSREATDTPPSEQREAAERGRSAADQVKHPQGEPPPIAATGAKTDAAGAAEEGSRRRNAADGEEEKGADRTQPADLRRPAFTDTELVHLVRAYSAMTTRDPIVWPKPLYDAVGAGIRGGRLFLNPTPTEQSVMAAAFRGVGLSRLLDPAVDAAAGSDVQPKSPQGLPPVSGTGGSEMDGIAHPSAEGAKEVAATVRPSDGGGVQPVESPQGLPPVSGTGGSEMDGIAHPSAKGAKEVAATVRPSGDVQPVEIVSDASETDRFAHPSADGGGEASAHHPSTAAGSSGGADESGVVAIQTCGEKLSRLPWEGLEPPAPAGEGKTSFFPARSGVAAGDHPLAHVLSKTEAKKAKKERQRVARRALRVPQVPKPQAAAGLPKEANPGELYCDAFETDRQARESGVVLATYEESLTHPPVAPPPPMPIKHSHVSERYLKQGWNDRESLFPHGDPIPLKNIGSARQGWVPPRGFQDGKVEL
ncbi:hypothetical protein DIPPA_05352 [Diplonema papillatum]|nr:hypothetical protein DIPPA_05352 [Diplonema papillatum]